MEEDWKWLWAAYKKGSFSDILKEDLSQKEFVETASILFQHAVGLYTIFSGEKAVGLIMIIDRIFLVDHYLEPHISWFDWATDRNKIEGVAKMVLELRKLAPVFIQVPVETSKFVTHIAKYGILRRVGRLDQNGEDKFLYESIRSK